MSSEDEEARRKIRELIREEVQAENRQETPSKKLGFYQKFHKYLVTQGEIPPTNRIYSYPDQASQDMVVQLNKDFYEEAKAEAENRGMSLSSYVRETLLHRLKKITPEKELEIERLLGECTSLEEEQITFIVEGEQGFLEQTKQRGLIGEVWTPSQIDKVALRLYTSPTTTIQQCIEAMNLDKMQTQYLVKQIEYLRNAEPKQEDWFRPFGICDQCLRPLTKDQFNNLSNCPYCNETKGTKFVYDKEAPDQSKPYAMCAECHRPLPREAEKWKTCKYCGTHEKEIVLNYEGIQRQTPSSTLKLDKEILEKLAESETPEETEEA